MHNHTTHRFRRRMPVSPLLSSQGMLMMMTLLRLLLGQNTATAFKAEFPRRYIVSLSFPVPFTITRAVQPCWNFNHERHHFAPNRVCSVSSFRNAPKTTSATSLKLSLQNHDRSTTADKRIRARSAWETDLNPSQVEAVTKSLTSITRVIAGPGSGKTR